MTHVTQLVKLARGPGGWSIGAHDRRKLSKGMVVVWLAVLPDT
jgi:hypothetical protein